MANLYTLITAYRAALLRQDAKAQRQLKNAYKTAYKSIKARSDKVLGQIATAREAGTPITPSWLYERDRVASLLVQVQTEINRFSRVAEDVIANTQATVIEQALDNSDSILRASFGKIPAGIEVAFSRVPTRAVESLVGALSEGSPLRSLLAELGPAASQAVSDAITSGVASGQGVKVIARQIRHHLGGNLTRALTISRTEVLRAHRTASLASFRANRSVLDGWTWVCSLGSRSCGACYAMHGTVHSLDEEMPSHPNCRCSMTPLSKSWADLGFPEMDDVKPEIESGQAAFDRLSDPDKARVLGSERAFREYRAGRVTLSDFVGTHSDPRWGEMTYRKPISAIRPAA